MKKRTVNAEGQGCRRCGTPVVKQTHSKPSKSKQAYWFRWWFRCPKCGTLYMDERSKVLRVDGQDIDANTGELITREDTLC